MIILKVLLFIDGARVTTSSNYLINLDLISNFPDFFSVIFRRESGTVYYHITLVTLMLQHRHYRNFVSVFFYRDTDKAAKFVF